LLQCSGSTPRMNTGFLTQTAPLPPTHMQHSQAHIADRCSSCGTPNRAECAPQPRHSTPCNSMVVCWGAVLARGCAGAKCFQKHNCCCECCVPQRKSTQHELLCRCCKVALVLCLTKQSPASNVTQPSNSTCDLQLSHNRRQLPNPVKTATANAGSCCPQR